MKKYLVVVILAGMLLAANVVGQAFDFEKIEKVVNQNSVIIEMKIEYAFGFHTNEQEERFLGTVVSEDGMIIFDGTPLASEGTLASLTGYNVKTTPMEIKINTLDGKVYNGEYIGADRNSKLGFIKIISENEKFSFLKFSNSGTPKVGQWMALYSLLPDYVSPSLMLDVGMISANLTSPETFSLFVGFNPSQVASVIFDEKGLPVGMLGRMNNPASDGFDGGSMAESYSQMGMPMFGLITTDKIEKLIAEPPEKGTNERGWLGITLQALTTEMAEFWGLTISSGIIVNDVVASSPAGKSGLQISDIIYEINGQPVEVDKEEKISVFQRMIGDMGPGADVEFSIYRPIDNGFDELKIITTLENTPLTATDAKEYENIPLELTIRELVFADYLIFNKKEDDFSGVIVSELKQGGLAEVEGLQIGDVIQQVNSQVINTADDIEAILTQLEETKAQEIIFFVWRYQKTMFVNIKTDW